MAWPSQAFGHEADRCEKDECGGARGIAFEVAGETAGM